MQEDTIKRLVNHTSGLSNNFKTCNSTQLHFEQVNERLNVYNYE